MDVSKSMVSVVLFNFVQFAKFQTSAWIEKSQSSFGEDGWNLWLIWKHCNGRHLTIFVEIQGGKGVTPEKGVLVYNVSLHPEFLPGYQLCVPPDKVFSSQRINNLRPHQQGLKGTGGPASKLEILGEFCRN